MSGRLLQRLNALLRPGLGPFALSSNVAKSSGNVAKKAHADLKDRATILPVSIVTFWRLKLEFGICF